MQKLWRSLFTAIYWRAPPQLGFHTASLYFCTLLLAANGTKQNKIKLSPRENVVAKSKYEIHEIAVGITWHIVLW